MKSIIPLVFFTTILFGCNAHSSDVIGVWERQYDGDLSSTIKELLTISKTSEGYEAEFYGWDFNGQYRKKHHALTLKGNELQIGRVPGLYSKTTDQISLNGNEYHRLSETDAKNIISTMDATNEIYAQNKVLCKEIQVEVNAKQPEGASMSANEWNSWVDEIGKRVPSGCIILGNGKRY